MWGIVNFTINRHFLTNNGEIFFINKSGVDYVLKIRKFHDESEITPVIYINGYIKSSSLVLPFESHNCGEDFLIDKVTCRLVTLSKKADLALNSRYILAFKNFEQLIGCHLAKIHKLMKVIPDNNLSGKLSWPKKTEKFNINSIMNHHYIAREVVDFYLFVKGNSEFLNNISKQWLHGDFRVNNLVLNRQDGGFQLKNIDFDNTSFFPRIYEIVRGFMCTVVNDKFPVNGSNLFDNYLDAYESIFPLLPMEREVLGAIYIWIGLSDVLVRVHINGCMSPYDRLVIKRCNYLIGFKSFKS